MFEFISVQKKMIMFILCSISLRCSHIKGMTNIYQSKTIEDHSMFDVWCSTYHYYKSFMDLPYCEEVPYFSTQHNKYFYILCWKSIILWFSAWLNCLLRAFKEENVIGQLSLPSFRMSKKHFSLKIYRTFCFLRPFYGHFSVHYKATFEFFIKNDKLTTCQKSI